MTRDTRSALHEAAHAVVAWRAGYPVLSVRLLERGGDASNLPGTDPLPQAIIAMAGHAADMKWHAEPSQLVPASDHYHVLAYGFSGRSLPTILALARGCVEEYADDIQRVATELKQRDLDEDDLEELLGEIDPAEDLPGLVRGWLLWVWVMVMYWITKWQMRHEEVER